MAISSTQARLTIQDAFERFAATVQPHDRREFQNTELQDVRNEAIKIERQLRARRTQRNMARLEPFLRGMEHYSKVIEVLCNGTPYLPWIWAPVKLMLMITVDSLGAFEKLIDAYGRIADMMPRIDRLDSALGSDQNFQSVLALIYGDILEFHRRAYKFVRRSSWHTFFGSMWAGFESRFSSILAQLAYHSKLLDKEAIALDISNATNQSRDQALKWERREEEWRTTKVRVVLSWLATGGPLPEDTLDKHAEQCLPKSCDWFLQDAKTKRWLRDGGSKATLWLTGKPGAGKSILCSSLIRYAQANAIHVFYYFCSYLDDSEGTSSRILRSLASQIIQRHQDLAIHVHDIYFQSHPVPTRKALLCLLPELLQGIGSTRLVIDGVDECSASDQVELLKDMTHLHTTGSPTLNCKILIASRNTLGISRAIYRKKGAVITTSLSDSQEDLAINRSIRQFIDDRLADLPDHLHDLDPDGSILAEVKQTLAAKSNGMFLWVRLVLDSLDTIYSPEAFRDVVNGLPSDLETLYERILHRICSVPGPQEYGGVPRIISWICCAQRPLLKHELLQGLAFSNNAAITDSRSIPLANILDHCKPFVEERSDSTIVFVHFSVKEFFIKHQSPQIISPSQGQLYISNACVVTLIHALNLAHSGADSSQNRIQVASGTYRVLSYAVEFWVEHCLLYASSADALVFDQSLSRNLTNLYDVHDRHNLNHGENGNGASKESGASKAKLDGRVALVCQLPIQGVMEEVLRARHQALEQACEDGKAVEDFMLSNDRTLFSRLRTTFDSIVVYLLSQTEVTGISKVTLEAFQNSYASTAFRCRYPRCARSSIGFASLQMQTQHEAGHNQRVYCREESCQYHRIGFAKRAALNAHMRALHAATPTFLIPAKVRNARDDDKAQSEDLISSPEHRTHATLDSTTPLSSTQEMVVQTESSEAELRAIVATPSVSEKPLTEQMRLDMIPAETDFSVKEHLLRVSDAQFLPILTDYIASLNRKGFPGNTTHSQSQALGDGDVRSALTDYQQSMRLHFQTKLGILKMQSAQNALAPPSGSIHPD